MYIPLVDPGVDGPTPPPLDPQNVRAAPPPPTSSTGLGPLHQHLYNCPIGVSPEYENENEYVCEIESVTGTGPSQKYNGEQEECDAEASTNPQ